MYSYVANWQIPRSHWSEVAQGAAAYKTVADKALADGTIVGYGFDEAVVHTADGDTHDDWWSSMSIAGLLKMRTQLFAAGTPTSPAMDAATKHWDEILMSRYYNKKSGSYKNAYTWVAMYQLKPDAGDDAVEMLSRNVIAPFLEKLFADGTILEYEIDEQAVHSQAPGTFSVVWVSPTAEGVDKVNAALFETVKAQPMIEPAFGSATKNSAHRDELLLSEGAYK
ncbi:MAG TPA: hypothetical protein VHE33_04315 [Acidobacteriaceae bacterium]|nr:hypothetical protein [Acidobacteriaceae bacterium]